MSFFTFKKLWRALVFTAVLAIGSVWLVGCGVKSNPANHNGNNNGGSSNGGSNVASSLVNAAGEAWTVCEGSGGGRYCWGFVFKSNGDVYAVSKEGSGGWDSEYLGKYTVTGNVVSVYGEPAAFSISGNTLILGGESYTKTSGVNI